jgi:hypothetical protein
MRCFHKILLDECSSWFKNNFKELMHTFPKGQVVILYCLIHLQLLVEVGLRAQNVV